jgi:hypothetical protein
MPEAAFVLYRSQPGFRSNQVQVQPDLGPMHPPRASNKRSYQVVAIHHPLQNVGTLCVKRETEMEEAV